MSFRKFAPHWIILLSVLGAISCVNDAWKKEYDATIRWEGGFRGPVAYGTLSIRDLLESFDSTAFLETDTAGLVFFVYSRDTVVRAPDFLELPDQEFSQIFEFPLDIPNAALPDTIRDTEFKEFKFARFDKERIDSVALKGGYMVIDAMSSIRHTGEIRVFSDNILLDGQPLDQIIPVSDASGNFDTTLTIDLAGSVIQMTNTTDSTRLEFGFAITMIKSDADISAGEQVEIIQTFNDLSFRGVYGLVPYDTAVFDRELLEIDNTFDLDGLIELADVRLELTVDNSFGIPFELDIGDLEGWFRDGGRQPVSIADSVNPIFINAPGAGEVGQSKSTFVRINRTNSNLNLIARTDLEAVQFSLDASTDTVSTKTHYLLDTSKLGIQVDASLPLHLRIDDLVLADTFEFNIQDAAGGIKDPDDIKSLYMRLDMGNGLPVDLSTQIYFADGNWIILDSLFSAGPENVLPSAPVDADGKVNGVTDPPPTEVTLNRGQIDNIWLTENLILNAFVESAGGGLDYVKFHENDFLRFHLAAGAEVTLLLSDEEE